MNCRYCNKLIDDADWVTTLAYWNQTPDVCHSGCKQAGERQEAIDCQVIDSDCNDCKHFKRNGITDEIKGTPTTNGVKAFTVFGDCLKFEKKTTGHPHFWTGRECFTHRRL